MRIAVKTIGGLYDGATTAELDELSIRTAAALIAEEPEYSRLAARLLATFIDKEVRNQDIHSFSQSVAAGRRPADRLGRDGGVRQAATRKLNDAIDRSRTSCSTTSACARSTTATCCGTPRAGKSIETPQYFFLRWPAAGRTVAEAIELYD